MTVSNVGRDIALAPQEGIVRSCFPARRRWERGIPRGSVIALRDRSSIRGHREGEIVSRRSRSQTLSQDSVFFFLINLFFFTTFNPQKNEAVSVVVIFSQLIAHQGSSIVR